MLRLKVVSHVLQSNPWRKIKEKVKPGGPVIANVGKGQIALNAFYNAFSGAPITYLLSLQSPFLF